MSTQLQCFISFLDTPFSDEQIMAFHSLNPYDAAMIQRIVVLDGRVLVRGISTPEIIEQTMTFLADSGKDPHLLFAHHEDGRQYGVDFVYTEDDQGNPVVPMGSPIYPPNFTEYLSFFPSYTADDGQGGTITMHPPQNTGAGWTLPAME